MRTTGNRVGGKTPRGFESPPFRPIITPVANAAKTTPRELDRDKALRNLHIHRQGKADQQYIERVGATSISVGDSVPVETEFAVATMQCLYAIAPKLNSAASKRFPTIVRHSENGEYTDGG